MPLPQQVINQLDHEPAKTPGWSVGILTFSFGIFAVMGLIYLTLTFAYEPYLNGQVTSLQGETSKLVQSISSDDQVKLVTFYSQISNLRTLLRGHIVFSQFLQWLERHTEANVYYTQFTFGSGNQITLSGFAKTEADANEQVAVFEAAPEVRSAIVSNVSFSSSNGLWQFAGRSS